MGRRIALVVFLVSIALLVWAGMARESTETASETVPVSEATEATVEPTESTAAPETTAYEELPPTGGERR